ncbi:MAG: hypothetical protein ACSHXL_01975 [Bacteroidota bacterium]
MLKKETLMVFKIATVLIAIPLIFSCATHKDLGSSAHEVEIALKNFIPYCGGAAPEPGVDMSRVEPLTNYSLILFAQNEDGSRGAELKEIKSNDVGSYNLNLPSGTYQLWLPTKKLSLEEFMKAESPDKGKDYIYQDKECFLAWKERADFTFEVASDTVISLQYSNRCYTDAHPCLKYNGPYRP